jgi:hypothetical protein
MHSCVPLISETPTLAEIITENAISASPALTELRQSFAH